MKLLYTLCFFFLFAQIQAQTINLIVSSGCNITRSYVRTGDTGEAFDPSGREFINSFVSPDLNVLFEFTSDVPKVPALSFKSGLYIHREKYNFLFPHTEGIVSGLEYKFVTWNEPIERNSTNVDVPALLSLNFAKTKMFHIDFGPYISLSRFKNAYGERVSNRSLSAGFQTMVGLGFRKLRLSMYYKTALHSQIEPSEPKYPNIEYAKSSIIGFNLSGVFRLSSK